MGIFNELSKDFNSGFDPANNPSQILELMNKYTRIRTRTGAFNQIIYDSWQKKEEEKPMPKTVSVSDIEDAINASTRPQVGNINITNNTSQISNYTQPSQNGTSSNRENEHETEDIMDM